MRGRRAITLAILVLALGAAGAGAAPRAAAAPASAPASAPGAAPAVPAPDRAQLTAFFRAVQLDDVRTVQSMLGTKVNANQLNPLGGEPGLVQAVREDAMRVVAAFLAHPGTDLEAKALNGNTALMMAAFKRNRPAVEALLAKGAAVNRPGWTALHYAAAAGDEEIARLLVARGARVDARSPAKSGAYTPTMMAAREGHDAVALMLIEKGANPRLKNGEGLTAVQLAERAGKPRVAETIARAMR